MLTEKGQALIELVIGFAILAIVLNSITLLIYSARESQERTANSLAGETAQLLQSEALRSVREDGWNNLQNGTYHVRNQGNNWTLEPGSEEVAGFTRQIEITAACRDGSGLLVDCPALVDPSTKKIAVSVAWSNFFGGSLEKTLYLSRYLNNTTWVQTTQADFLNGWHDNTVTSNSSGGEVQLGSGADWSNPGAVSSGTYNNPGNEDAYDVFIKNNYAYLVTGDSGSGQDFIILDISNPATPVPRGTLNIGSTVNAVVGEDDPSAGRFAYLATANDTKELTVLNTSNKNSPVEVASLDLGDGANALDISLDGAGNKKFAYIGKQASSGTNKEFYIVSVNTCFDVTGDSAVSGLDLFAFLPHQGETGPSIYDLNGDDAVSGVDLFLLTGKFGQTCPHNPAPNIIGEFEIGDGPASANAVNSVFVLGNKAYLATSADNKDLIVVDITNKRVPTELGSFNSTGSSDAYDVYVSDNKAYLTTQNNSSTNPEFYIVDISNPATLSSSSPLGTYNVGDSVNSVLVSQGLALLSTDLDNQEFLVLKVSSPTSISPLGSVDLPSSGSDANAISLINNYAYLATDHNGRELQIIQAGPGTTFAQLGTFESSTFNAIGNVGFNRLIWNVQKPPTTNVQFQISTNNDAATWTYVGPDGTPATFFTIPAAIPLNAVSARYLRFKATLTGNGSISPILEDVTVNYSP